MGLISWLIVLPLLTALAVALVPARQWRTIRWIAAAGTGTHLVLTAITTYLYLQAASPDAAAMQGSLFTRLHLVERVSWFQPLGIQYLVGVDGISMSMVILTSIIIFTGVLASWSVEERTKE